MILVLTEGATGTAWISQIGVLAILVLTWITVLRGDIILFTGHPLAQSIGVLAVIQSIIVLQPTHTPDQKRIGQRIHGILHLVSLCSFIAGVAVIEYNKIHNGLAHFHSPHAYIGVITCIVIALQYLVGFTMWAVPVLYGGEANARKVWKYHRYSGYLVLILLIASLVSAAKTDFMKVLGMEFWIMAVGCVAVVIGIIPRIQLHKLGYRK